jgi:hypothetical protein
VLRALLAILAGSGYHTIPADRRLRWALAVRTQDRSTVMFGLPDAAELDLGPPQDVNPEIAHD